MSSWFAASASESRSSTGAAANDSSSRRALVLGSVLLFALVALVYWPALRGPFIWDDALVIQQNPLVKGEFSLGSI